MAKPAIIPPMPRAPKISQAKVITDNLRAEKQNAEQNLENVGRRVRTVARTIGKTVSNAVRASKGGVRIVPSKPQVKGETRTNPENKNFKPTGAYSKVKTYGVGYGP